VQVPARGANRGLHVITPADCPQVPGTRRGMAQDDEPTRSASTGLKGVRYPSGRERPTTGEAFLGIKGVGQYKLAGLSPRFLGCIRAHLDPPAEHGQPGP
jgi:hypothetical protein